MTDLTGFTATAPLNPLPGPQALQVPATMEDAAAVAAQVLGALAALVASGLTPHVQIDIVPKVDPDGTSYPICNVSAWRSDGVTKTTAGPGWWIAIDGSKPEAMSNDDYAAAYTQAVPVVWAATTVAPVLALSDAGAASLVFPQPTSANRPFTYTVKDSAGATVAVSGAPTVAADGTVTLQLDVAAVAAGASAGPYTAHVATQYSAVAEVDSLPSNTVTQPSA